MSLMSLKNDDVVESHEDDSGNSSNATEVDPVTRNDNNSNDSYNKVKKLHHWTVCMVPPPTITSADHQHNKKNAEQEVWEQITHCRTELRDPGLFRWPPHANLLYPFIDCFVEPQKQDEMTTEDGDKVLIQDTSSMVVQPDILEKLVHACRQCEPFAVRLDKFGTFGGKRRGVLWLYPDSRRRLQNDLPLQQLQTPEHFDDEPLVRLQSLLMQAFPFCNDQNQKSSGGQVSFTPHMTVTHFASLEEAEAARIYWQARWPCTNEGTNNSLTFTVDRIYVMTRKGDNGQFLRVMDVPLGNHSNEKSVIVHNPPIPFPTMPQQEPDWVRKERMKLKERRKNNSSSGWKLRRRSSRSRPRPPPDTPEVIATKRAERQAKRNAAAADVKRNMTHE